MSTPVLIDVLPQHRIDAAAVAAWLRPRLAAQSAQSAQSARSAQFDGQVAIRQFQGGQSNPTYHLATSAGDWVLRKKPPGVLLPSAHAVEREYRVMQALAGSGVPVPRMLGLCEDAAVIGTPFFVMQHVPGRVLGARVPGEAASPAERRTVTLDLARVLAVLHGVDWRACGLSDFGRPEGYLQRQVARWSAQWEASRTEPLPAMEQLRAWLQTRLQTSLQTRPQARLPGMPDAPPGAAEAALVHGDYRLGNVLVAPHSSCVAAVLDWELATIGHPLADLAYLCLTYHLPASEGGCADDPDLAAHGIPTQDELVQHYCRHAGRTVPPESLAVFIVFSMFRLAAIVAGVYRRALDGNAADRGALGFRERLHSVANIGWALARAAAV